LCISDQIISQVTDNWPWQAP